MLRGCSPENRRAGARATEPLETNTVRQQTVFTVPREDCVCVGGTRSRVTKKGESVGLLTQLKLSTCLFSRRPPFGGKSRDDAA